MTLFKINSDLIGLNLMNSTVLLFNVSESTISLKSIALNFTSFGYCIPYHGHTYPAIACFGVQLNQNILFIYDVLNNVVADTLIELESSIIILFIIYKLFIKSTSE